eukprot:scaffold244073_cov17-Tisochrysis_lutea.AAC.1
MQAPGATSRKEPQACKCHRRKGATSCQKRATSAAQKDAQVAQQGTTSSCSLPKQPTKEPQAAQQKNHKQLLFAKAAQQGTLCSSSLPKQHSKEPHAAQWYPISFGARPLTLDLVALDPVQRFKAPGKFQSREFHDQWCSLVVQEFWRLKGHQGP